MCNIRGYDEDKIKAHTNCRKVWELWTADKLKESQFAGCGGSITSKIVGL